MRRGVDAARKTRDDGVTVPAEVSCQHARHLDAGKRGIAGADDGHRGQAKHRTFTLHRQQRRRVVHGLQQSRVVGLADADKAGAGAPRGIQFRLGLGDGRNADDAVRAA